MKKNIDFKKKAELSLSLGDKNGTKKGEGEGEKKF